MHSEYSSCDINSELHKRIPELIFRSEATQQTRVCNDNTLQYEGNRCIQATSTYWPWQTQCTESQTLHTVIQRLALTGMHVKQACFRVQSGTQCIRSSCILFQAKLAKGLQQGTMIFTPSSVNGIYTKL
jgi:hypothetical protein